MSNERTITHLDDGFTLVTEYAETPPWVPAPATPTHTVLDAHGNTIGVVDFPSYAPILIAAHLRGTDEDNA